MLEKVVEGNVTININELLEAVKKINNLLKDNVNLKKEKYELEDKIKTRKLELLGQILGEVDDNGKAVYSNETKREIELNRRIRNDDLYNELFNRYKIIVNTMEMNEVEIETFKLLLKVYEITKN